MFGGPWYEYQGPSVADVRKDVLNHLNIIKVGDNNFDSTVFSKIST